MRGLGLMGLYVKFRGPCRGQLGPLAELCQIPALLRCLSKSRGVSGPYHPPLATVIAEIRED